MAGELNRIEMSSCGPSITPEDIRRFEEYAKLSLPKRYIEFLIAYNGGNIYPMVFRIDTNDSIQSDWLPIDFFYSLISDTPDTVSRPHLHKIIERQNSYGPSEGLNPPHSIPIASVLSTDDLLLFVDGDHRGEVWVKLWHMCDDEDFPNPWSWCYKVGDDLFDFLGKLEEGPE